MCVFFYFLIEKIWNDNEGRLRTSHSAQPPETWWWSKYFQFQRYQISLDNLSVIRKSYLEHFGDEIKLNGDAYFIGLHLRRIFSYSVFGMSMNTAVSWPWMAPWFSLCLFWCCGWFAVWLAGCLAVWRQAEPDRFEPCLMEASFTA